MKITKGGVFLILFLVLGFGGAVYWSNQKIPEVSNKMMLFQESAINGTLSSINIKYKMIYFSVENQDVHYLFSPISSELNNNTEFYKSAQKGDLIMKPSFSDTLTLLKVYGRVYQYTFRILDKD